MSFQLVIVTQAPFPMISSLIEKGNSFTKEAPNFPISDKHSSPHLTWLISQCLPGFYPRKSNNLRKNNGHWDKKEHETTRVMIEFYGTTGGDIHPLFLFLWALSILPNLSDSSWQECRTHCGMRNGPGWGIPTLQHRVKNMTNDCLWFSLLKKLRNTESQSAISNTQVVLWKGQHGLRTCEMSWTTVTFLPNCDISVPPFLRILWLAK